MKNTEDFLLDCPVIAAVHGSMLNEALKSPAEIIFLLDANILTVSDFIDKAHNSNKKLFIHIDLAEGIGKDKAGIEYLCRLGVDGIISTRQSIIKTAKEKNLLTVQRIFALDSKGVSAAFDLLKTTNPDFVEVMPGIAFKVTEKISNICSIPVIAGGLIETKTEVISALDSGALAVSTGKEELWYI